MGDFASNEAWLGELMDRRGPDIVRRWIARVDSDINASGRGGVSQAELRDAMPDYVARLADALREGGADDDRGTAAWSEIAKDHAVARVRLGFDIDQLIHEFIVLRRIVLEIATEESGALAGAQVARLVDLLEAGMAVAVKAYVESRDYAARVREAEHVGFLSHELRNPLNAAQIAVGRLRGAALDEVGLKALRTIDRNIERLVALLDGALHMGRLAAGKVEARPQTIALGTLLQAPLANAKTAAAAKGLGVDVKLDDAALVCADPELTGIAVSNVLDNAVKYTDTGRIEIASEATEDRVVVRIRDNCCGISDAELSVIFEPFERGHTGKPGSGLGLAIARRALEAEGATIGAESSGSGRGCQFAIALPRARS